MSEHQVINIIYDTEQEAFDFIVPTSADKFIKGDERYLSDILELLKQRLRTKEYPFAFLHDENNYQVDDMLIAKHECMNNFRKNQIVTVTEVNGNQVVIDGVVALDDDAVREHFNYYRL